MEIVTVPLVAFIAVPTLALVPAPANHPRRTRGFWPPSRASLLSWGIAAVAFLIRIPNLRWGLPHAEEEALPVQKAFEMWGWDQGQVTLDPHTAGWPSLSFYVHFALQRAHYAIGKVTGRYDDRLDFFMEHVDISTLMPAARFVSVVAAVALVMVGVRLAQRLVGNFGSLVVGLLLASSPLLIEYSLKVAPDILLTLFAALALVRIIDVYEKGRLRDYVWSAVWIALGVASKYTPILLVPCLVGAHVARQWNTGRWRTWLDGKLLLAGVVLAATFVATSPFAILNAVSAQRDFSSQFTHLVTAGHFGHEVRGNGYVFYLVTALPAAIGWPALILGLSGLMLAAWRQRGAWLLVFSAFAVYYVGFGALRALFAHYMLPAILPVVLGLAALIGEFRRTSWAHHRRRSVALALAFLAIVLIPPAVGSARQHLRDARPSTTQQASEFIMQELSGADVHFACEIGGPYLPLSPETRFAQRGVFQRLDAARREELLNRPFVPRYLINLYMTDAKGSDLFYDLRHYLNYDYIIVSGTARHRYAALPESYPRQTAFYEDLEEFCKLVRYFPASSDRRGPDVWIYAVVPTTARILDERGGLSSGFHATHMKRIRRGDLHSFLGFTGGLALRREDWQNANLYLSTLLEFRSDIREELLLTVAEVKYRAGDLRGAAELIAERLQKRPDDSTARALGAAIVQKINGGAESSVSPRP